ncbi:MAG: HupE/UreJ family protein [Vicinamibacterales bacterium]|nr:HupE/UreJ family protein [Vicinamibacterales bacterium]
MIRSKNPSTLIAFAVLMCGLCAPASAHPVPFSYIDARLQPGAVEVTLVAHVFDVAHDLGLEPPERLLDQSTLTPHADAIVTLLRDRLQIAVDGKVLSASTWSRPEPLIERQALQLRASYPISGAAGALTVTAALFPYDPKHQTFVNVYEHDTVVSQSMLDVDHPQAEYFSGTRQGVWAVVRRFGPSGIHHILIGPDHLLFLVGLLLLGGSVRRLLVIVTAFTLAHSLTLSLAALNIVVPPAGIIEPAIALSIVYVGADNLLVRGGRDMRGWIAFAFGFIHGFGFANVLREMDLPARALGWSLFSFNIGVEIGQLFVVATVATALAVLHSRSEAASRRLVFAGSVFVMAAGTFWFVQRVFFPGGIA